jgi:hypothetical protein
MPGKNQVCNNIFYQTFLAAEGYTVTAYNSFTFVKFFAAIAWRMSW